MVEEVEPPPGRLVRLGVVVRPGDPGGQHRLARMCDLAGVDVLWVDDEQVAVAVAGAVGRARVLVRPEVDEPWARTVPVSVGRTPAEAEARAALDPALACYGDLEADGLFGTIERAQLRVIELAHSGVTDLRCVLPDVPDVHDVVAQLTAVVVGSTATHRPDAPRSADPEPPPWAGRRPSAPPA
jgi:hypothetical protein